MEKKWLKKLLILYMKLNEKMKFENRLYQYKHSLCALIYNFLLHRLIIYLNLFRIFLNKLELFLINIFNMLLIK